MQILTSFCLIVAKIRYVIDNELVVWNQNNIQIARFRWYDVLQYDQLIMYEYQTPLPNICSPWHYILYVVMEITLIVENLVPFVYTPLLQKIFAKRSQTDFFCLKRQLLLMLANLANPNEQVFHNPLLWRCSYTYRHCLYDRRIPFAQA